MSDIVQKLWDFATRNSMKRRSFFIALGIALLCSITSASSVTNTVTVRPDDESRQLLREATEDKWIKKDTFVSTVIGGLLAALAGLAASWYANRLEALREKEAETVFVRQTLVSIRCEMSAIKAILDDMVGENLEKLKEAEFLGQRFTLTQNLFSVFESNALHLGKIQPELSQQVIKIYILLKSLLDDLHLNNGHLDELDSLTGEIRNFKARLEYYTDHMEKNRDINTMILLEQRKKIIEGLLVGSAQRLKQTSQMFSTEYAFFCQALIPLGIN